jgi:hypothetical protein
MQGNIQIKITATITDNIRFYITENVVCPTLSYTLNDTIINEQITGDYNVTYNTRGYGFSSIWYTTNNCEFDTIFSFNNIIYTNLTNYVLYDKNNNSYTVNYQFLPKDKINPCNITIHLSNLMNTFIYTNAVLIYGNTQIVDYLLLNQTYDMNWNGNVTLKSSSTVYTNYQFIKVNDSQVYFIIKNYPVNVTSYFDPLISYYGNYNVGTITLDGNFNLSNSNLNFNNAYVNITLVDIPIDTSVQDSTLLLNNDVSIKNIQFVGENQLILNNQSIINTSTADFSGNLTISISSTIPDNSNLTIIKYSNHTGEFDNLIIQNISNCTNYRVEYTKSALVAFFQVNTTCNSPGGNTLFLYIIIPVIVFLVISTIIIVIVIFKVRKCRREVLPHRDRTMFKSKSNLNATLGTKKGTYKIRSNKSNTNFPDIVPASHQSNQGEQNLDSGNSSPNSNEILVPSGESYGTVYKSMITSKLERENTSSNLDVYNITETN